MPAKYKEVGTQEAGPEVFKVKDSGSKWRRRDLELLGVEYRYDKFDEVEIPVNFMPLELVARIVPFLMLWVWAVVIEATAKKIESVDMSVVRRRGVEHEVLDMLAKNDLLLFASTYNSLGTLLARVRSSKGTIPVVFETPPGQTTVPQNPNLSGGSSSSAESKGEPYVNNFAAKFLESTYFTIARWLEPIQWVNPKAQAFLFRQYTLPFGRLSDLVPIQPCVYVLVKHK
jgi:hypothetical protein